MECPGDAALAQFAGARLDTDQPLRVHVEGCESCRARLSVLMQHQETLDSDAPDLVPIRPSLGDWRFRVEVEFARGGLGAVYRAHDARLGRVVAIKQLRAHNPEAAMRFRREALITARLQHPAIVPVYEAGTFPSGKPFYAMRLVAGRPLREHVEEARTFEQRLALLPNLITVAEAVAYAHSQGVIHRDLKPANVIVGDFGETVVIDWGLAKQLHDADSPAALAAGGEGDDSTRVGAVMGTPQYMPPEQARGLPVDARADVYALGAILYHMLVGLPPYRGSADEALKAVVDAAPPAIETLQRGVPPDLSAIVRKAMARDPDERYRDAGAFAADLRRFVSGQLVRAHSYSTATLVARWIARNRLPVALSAMFTVALIVGSVVAMTRIVRESGRVIARSNQLILASARASLESDPTAALAWLKSYPLDGEDWDQARSLALEALGTGVASDIFWPYGGVSFGALSPDGQLLARQSASMPIEINEVESGRPVRRIPVARHLWGLHFSPDGRRIFSDGEGTGAQVGGWDVQSGLAQPTAVGAATSIKALDDAGARAAFGVTRSGSIRVVDFATGQATSILELSEPLVDLCVDRQHQRVIAVGDSGVLVVRDLPSGPTRRLVPRGKVTGCILASDGQWLVSFGDALQLWDLDSGAMTELRGKGLPIGAAAVMPDGSVAAGDEKGQVTLYNRRGAPTQMLEGHTRGINNLALGDGGTRLASASRDGTVRVWDPRSGDSSILRGHASQVVAATLTDDGRHLLSVSADTSMRLWRVPRDALDAFHAHAGEVSSLAVLDDAQIVTSGLEDERVKLTDFATRTVTTLAEHPHGSHRLSLSRDRKLLAFATSDGAAVVWRRGSDLRRLSVPQEKINRAIVGCDDDQLVTTSSAGSIHVWSLATGTARLVVAKYGSNISNAALSPDCHLLATQGVDFKLRVFDLVAGGAPRVYSELAGWALKLWFSPDSSRLAAASRDGKLHIFDLAGGRGLVIQHRAEMGDLAASPDGRYLATGDTKGELRVTDVREGVSRVLHGHTGGIFALTFSPDGNWLATGSADRKLRIWDLASGAQVAAIAAGDTIVCAAFLPDGKRVVTGDNTGMVRLWRIRPMGPSSNDPAALRRWMLSTTNVVLRSDGVLASE
jgi:WD40 repeat protein